MTLEDTPHLGRLSNDQTTWEEHKTENKLVSFVIFFMIPESQWTNTLPSSIGGIK